MQLRRGPLVVRGASSWRVIGRGALAGRGSPIRRRATRVGVTEGGGRSGGRHRKRGVAGDCTFGGREFGVVAGRGLTFRPMAIKLQRTALSRLSDRGPKLVIEPPDGGVVLSSR